MAAEPGTHAPGAAEERRPIDLAPVPRIQRLSSAIVWIAAILAVSVLWIVGYLVTSRANREARERKPPTAPSVPLEDLAERIRRAAEREAEAAAERAERARSQMPPSLPPGFEDLFAGRQSLPQDLAAPTAGADDWQPIQHPPPAPQESSLERAQGSPLVPDGFRSASPPHLEGKGSRRASPDGPEAPPMAGFVELRDRLDSTLDAVNGGGLGHAAAETTTTEEPRMSVLGREPRAVGHLEPGSPLTLHAGTLIPAVLTAGIHSDLPGPAMALVRRPVFDTLTGRSLLIPQGSRLVGEHDTRVAVGQKRVLLAWQRIVFPDGRSLELGGMPGADLAGAAGLHDKVDNHFVRTFGGALLLAAISAGFQLSQPDDDGEGRFQPTPSQVAAAAVGQELGRVATEVVRRSMDLRPTLRVRPGYPFQVEVTADLVFDRPYPEPIVHR